MYLVKSILFFLIIHLTNCQMKMKKGLRVKTTPVKTTVITRPKPTRTTERDCASISLFRYQHLVALNWTTTTTEWNEVSRLKKRMDDNHPRKSIIIDLLRTKYNLMTEKQSFKLEFKRLKKYVLKIGGNGSRFLDTFQKIAKQNLKYEQQVVQIDQILSKYGLPKYEHINRKFTYLTKPNTPPLNYTPTEKWSKMMWYKTSVLDVRYQKYFVEKVSNPVVWEDVGLFTTGDWMVALENMPGFKHHKRKFNLPQKKARRINATIEYYRKLAEMRRLNITIPYKDFTGTLIPTTTIKYNYEQPDVFEAINRYFNQCSIGQSNDPWVRL